VSSWAGVTIRIVLDLGGRRGSVSWEKSRFMPSAFDCWRSSRAISAAILRRGAIIKTQASLEESNRVELGFE
jgi:hypothetical protein